MITLIPLLSQISAQDGKSIEARLASLELKVKEIEQRLMKLEEPIGKKESERVQVSKSPMSVKLVSKLFHVADYMSGDSGDRIDFEFVFTNHLKKDVRAFTGALVFKDLFDRDIMRVNLTDESGVKTGGTVNWQGGIDFNQFLDPHQRLRSIDKKDLSVEFILNKVIYADGTRESFSIEN